MLPLGDFPNPRGTPYVNYALIAINVTVFGLVTLPLSFQGVDPSDPLLPKYLQLLARHVPGAGSAHQVLSQISAYDLFLFRFGFRPAEPSGATLFTSMFLHGGFMHLFGNMLFLWIYGDNVEHRLGRFWYLFAYLATGMAATAGHWMLNPSSPFPSVGASGAISGVLGFYFIFFPRNRVRVLLPFFPFFFQIIEVPARLVLGFYLVIDNILPLLASGGGGTGVAYGAHLGGFVAGLAAAWVIERRGPSSRPKEYRSWKKVVPLERPPAEEMAQAVRLEDFEHAARLYFAMRPEEAKGALTPAESLALGHWLADNGHPEAALTLYRRHLRDSPRDATRAEAHTAAGWILLRTKDEIPAAYQHFLQALDEDPSPEIETSAREGLAEIAARQKQPRSRR
jgi:membrane associated rhomboid family serine protease